MVHMLIIRVLAGNRVYPVHVLFTSKLHQAMEDFLDTVETARANRLNLKYGNSIIPSEELTAVLLEGVV